METAKNNNPELNKFVGHLPGMVYQFRLSPEGKTSFPFTSDAIKTIYGFSPDEVQQDAAVVFSIIHPDDLDLLNQTIFQSAQDLTAWEHEFRVRFADGNVRWLYGNSLPEREPDGSTLWHGFITDITDRKEYERRVLESEKQFRDMFELNQFPMLILDPSSCDIIDVNQAALHFYGYDRQELCGMNISILDRSITQKEIPTINETVLSAELTDLLLKHHTKTGEIKSVEAQLLTITIQEKPAFLAIIIDRTKREQLAIQLKIEQEYSTFLKAELLIERQENERISISTELHENINQILAASKLMLDMSFQKAVKDKHMEKGLSYLEKAIQMINELSQNLTPALTIMSLNDALHELIKKSEMYAGITISYDNDCPLFNPPAKEKLFIYRVVEELLNDIILQKEATYVSISLFQKNENELIISLYNDTIVLNCEEKNSCLYELKKRVEFHKGEFAISKVEEGGCEIRITLLQTVKNSQQQQKEIY